MRPNASTKRDPQQLRRQAKSLAAEERNHVDDRHGSSARSYISSRSDCDDQDIYEEVDKRGQSLESSRRAHKRDPREDVRIDEVLKEER
jgi:hypothetical protein